MNINKILVLSLLGMMISSQSFARDEITCPTGTASGSTCWKCGDNCTATLTGGKMTVSGTGAMYDYNWKKVSGSPNWAPTSPWSDRRLEIKSIEISDNITRIGDYAFSLSYNVTDLKLGNSIKSMGKASMHSLSVSDITIPKSIEYIGNTAFASNFTSHPITSILFEEGSQLKTIDEAAFAYAGITNIDIPDTVTYIGRDTFYECHSLSSVDLPDNPNLVIGAQIFKNTQLTNVALPEGVTSAENAFQNMQSTVTVYCTQSIIDAGHCNSSYLYKSPLNVTHYERDGDHFNVYDSNGEIVAQYGSLIDFGTTNYYVPKAPKEAKRIYTVEEATETAKGNKNTFSIRYR